MKVDSDATTELDELRLHYNNTTMLTFGNPGEDPKIKNSSLTELLDSKRLNHNLCVVILINARATRRIKTSPNRTHIKEKLDGKLAKISK